MQEHRRILRKAALLPAKALTEWEQGFVAGGESPAAYAKVVDRLRGKVEAYEAENGPLSILDAAA